ncbi:FG-GAP-like repeat-containing protein [Tamlana crocina]|uniref:T9SS type A sorting domain-containing protein n=1 Tax=Tamlana crocina TaxID=393006 RepID=A0ABX1DDA5_9FLAO|nr:FG-GAP-like repeat-containing protein [Tamlana crocina]NJX16346.1 T9SS type A sorting domain-containing protein [Tamlana crocina]
MKRLLLSFIFIAPLLINAQFYFQEIQNSGVPPVGQGATDMADVDGDGDLDLFVTGNNLGVYIAKLYLNDGNGIFSESASNVFKGASVSTAHFFDADNDNDMDIIYMGVNNTYSRVAKLYLNDGNGGFTEDTQNAFTGMSRGDITTGDIDGDNDVDLLLSGEIGATGLTNLYLNNGSGIFTLAITPFPNVSVSNCKFHDIDHDNDLDFFITGYDGNEYISKYFFNNGSGTFTEQPYHQFAQGNGGFLFLDVDNDFDDDIIITGANNGTNVKSATLFLNRNDAPGYFTYKETNFEGLANGSIDAADLNKDGFLDVIFTGINTFNEPKTNLYFGGPDATFNLAEDHSFIGGYYSKIKLLGDIDNDGDDDLFLFGVDLDASVYGKVYRNVKLDVENHPDYNTLVVLYNALNGSNWFDSTNWLDTTKPLSSWYGITETNGRVTGIDLGSQNNVSGTIPPEIANLTELQDFWIQDAYIAGEIPPSIGNLIKLRQLVLYYTYGLTGNIPTSIQNCANLEWLYLGGNQLEGQIPDLTHLNNLTDIDINNNKFQFGDFENEFATYFSNVPQFYYAPQRKVSPDVEAVLDIGQTETLNVSVSGSQNSYDWYRINADGSDGGYVSSGPSLNVTINTADDYKWYYYYEATSGIVAGLTLRSGFFHFTEPPTTSADYNALVALYNSTNGDSWTNNTNWLDATKPLNTWYGIYNVVNNRVVDLNIGNNNLTGSIPAEIGNLTELTYLSLWGNELTGNIPPEIGNLTKLTYLDLAPNNFSGSIPTEIGNLVNLETLWLNQSGLSGSIPASLANLTKLKHLHLHSSIGPGWGDNTSAYSGDFPDLTALPLELLHIYNNYFEFTDIADELETYKANIPDFQFSPQFTQDLPEDTNIGVGSDITLTVTDVPIASKGMKTKTVLAQNTYQWFKDNVAITENGNSDTYVINNAQTSDSGIYHCEITNTDTPDFVIRRAFITLNVGTLGTEEQQLEQLRIYPNPTTSVLNIKLKGQNNAHVAIFDTSGKEVFKKQIATQWGVFNIESLNTGVYMLQVKTNGKTIKKRIVKK